MRMHSPEIEIVTFDTTDVITTSGGGQAVVDVIWIDKYSIYNFNDYAYEHSGYELDVGYPLEQAKMYYSYSGDLMTSRRGTYFTTAQSSDSFPPPQGAPIESLYSMGENDVASYNKILAWLNTHGNK